MSITDELRNWWVRKFPVMDKELHKDFTAIADRIDAEHESACAEAYGNGVMSVPIALDESAWVELPKDADGEYIHEHDKVDWRDHAGTWHKNATVMAVCNDGCYVMDGTVFHVHKSDIRHHHAPTVEDVLREFAYGLGVPVADSYIAASAAKLRLAEGEDA